MTNRSQKSRQRTAICRFSFVIGHWSFGKSFSAVSAVVRKNVAPASRRHLSLDNSFWVNTTFAGWKPAIHFFSRPQRTQRFGPWSNTLHAGCVRSQGEIVAGKISGGPFAPSRLRG